MRLAFLNHGAANEGDSTDPLRAPFACDSQSNTYKIKEDSKSVLTQFRSDYDPRIAVLVDMIATGTGTGAKPPFDAPWQQFGFRAPGNRSSF